MKTSSKVVIAVVVLAVVGAGVYASVGLSGRGGTEVQAGAVVRRNIANTVSATGEIKPKNYINIGANAMGTLTEILVKEGDHVHKGQLLARIEDRQAQADVESQQASLNAAEADAAASEAGVGASDESLATAQAVIDRGKADLERMKGEYDRAEGLLKEKLIARQEFEQKKSAWEAQAASVRESQTRLAQSRAQRMQAAAQLSSSQKKIVQVRAGLARVSDVLSKFNAFAPLDGIVTNLPVRPGETVVPGVQNSSASLIMTIADMSVITAEVKVDESDIVNIRVGQPVDITIDALVGHGFHGHVTEIGNTAILRSTGVAASQSATSSQEAKDFKVVVAVDDPPAEIRPGLSCTVKITTATRQGALILPIQALTTRLPEDLGTQTAKPSQPTSDGEQPEEITGVFVVAGGKAQFRKVTTGITGSANIEVVSGLNEGDQVVTGSYQTLRTLKDNAPVKIVAAPKETPKS